MHGKELLTGTMLDNCLAEARRVLEVEAQSVLNLKNSINADFVSVIKLIISSSGRVIFTGVGKSGLIAQKMAATFSSTGTPAFFVHAGEALHGDLGMITKEDMVIAISNSGESEEVLRLIPSIKRIGASLVSFTGEQSSSLARLSDFSLFAGVEVEACPYGLAPTASTTATMALGDSLAIALSTLKGFTIKDFALFHPGGSLGRRLLTLVRDVLDIRNENPVISEHSSVKNALFVMTASKMGSTSIVNQEGLLVGIITDGDIRRLLERTTDFLNKPVREVMSKNPTTITLDKLATEAVKLMEEREIKDLPVIEQGKPVGMLNVQDLLKAKIF